MRKPLRVFPQGRNITGIIKLQKQLQQDVYDIKLFCDEWCLKQNESKTTYTTFITAGKRKSYERLYSMNIDLNNTQINLDTYPKFLGITFDPKLSFEQHITQMQQKINQKVNILKIFLEETLDLEKSTFT
jgi:hypothetical protein